MLIILKVSTNAEYLCALYYNKKQMEGIKILVISNNLLSENNANGKFVYNYLRAFSVNELCNFYISNDEVTTSDIRNVFNVTNEEALTAFKKIGFIKERSKNSQSNVSDGSKTIKKSAFKHLIRFIVWNTGFWKKYGFNEWIKEQKPTHIFSIMGDNPYLLKVAIKLSNKLKVPHFFLVGEDYPLKEYDYIKGTFKSNFIYKLFHNLLFKYSKKLLNKSKKVIFNSNDIMEAYLSKIEIEKTKTEVIYPLSMVIKYDRSDEKDGFLYAGNLSNNRVLALQSFASKIEQMGIKSNLYICGKADKEVLKIIGNSKNIVYLGCFSNTELSDIIGNFKVLIHAEYGSKYNVLNLKYAFSTKLTEMICSNKRFAIYAPAGIAESNYFLKNMPSNIATTEFNLEKVIHYSLSDEYDFGIQSKLAAKHSSEKVSIKIRKMLENY